MPACYLTHRYRAPGTIADALFKILVRPLLDAPGVRPKVQHASRRLFRGTRIVALQRARPPVARPHAWDDEIPAEWVQIIDQQTKRPGEPRRLKYILQSLNKDYRVVCQQAIPSKVPPDWMPMCKIVSKTEAFEQQKAALQKARNSKKASMASKPRMIEINWAIEQHDLDVRLGRLRDLLREGKKVEILLARKRKSRKASPAECRALMQAMHDELDAIGAKHVVPQSGEEGKLIRITVEGPAASKTQNDAS